MSKSSSEQQSPSSRGVGRRSRPVIKKRSKLGAAVLGISIFSAGAVIGFGGQYFAGGEIQKVIPGLSSASATHAELMSRAVTAVGEVMPESTIVGVSAGPARTTQVLTQVLGKDIMQSVYVLPDGKTVLSGFVVDSVIDSTVAKSASEPSLTDESGSDVSVASSNDSGSLTQQIAEKVDPAGSAKTPELPEVPAPKMVDEPDPQQEDASHETEVASSPEQSESESDASSSKPVTSGLAAAGIVVESIDSLLGAKPFGEAVRTMLRNDSDIDSIRQMSGAEDFQQSYYDLVKSLPSIVQGSGPRHLYVMFDPNCPVCNTYYKEVYPEIQRGKVTVHWIPTIIFPDQRTSLNSAAIMIAESEAGADRGSDMLHRVMTERGFIGQLSASDRAAGVTPYLESVVKNTAVMAMAKPETPLIIFKDRNDKLTIDSGIPVRGYLAGVKHDEG